MSTTRTAIRQQVGYDLDEIMVGVLTAATATTAQVWALADSQRHEQDLQGAWLYLTDGSLEGTEVRLALLNPANGMIQLASAGWNVAGGYPAAGDGFEIHTLIPASTLNRIIARAVGQLGHKVSYELEIPSMATASYDLAEYTTLTDPSQVLGVRYRSGSEAGGYRYRKAKWHRVEWDDGGLVLTVQAGYASTSEVLLLDCWEPYALDPDDDTTACPPEWLLAAVRVQVYEELIRRGPGESVAHYSALLADERQKLLGHHMRYGPGLRVNLSMPNRGGD
jgi:hypothetical protein